jgi:zinc/manganese transport system substrate-binding protein
MWHSLPIRRVLVAAVILGTAAFTAGCGGAARPSADAGIVEVVAAENFWGSLVGSVGGSHVHVTSIIASQSIDPHDYEPTPADGRALARARYVIINGLGYDGWADRLVAASPNESRVVLRVQDALGLRDGDNPHRWYAPDDVLAVVDRIASDLALVDPTNAAAYEAQRAAFVATGLGPYREAVAAIRSTYAGVPVGATESVAVPLVDALGLRLLSPPTFLNAIAEGADPTPQDKATMDDQVRRHLIKVMIVNRQNSTPDVQRVVEAAQASGVPVVEITETPLPVTARFEDWQVAQLQALAAALKQATGS